MVNPIYERTEMIFEWIMNLFKISTIRDPNFNHEIEINNLIMQKG